MNVQAAIRLLCRASFALEQCAPNDPLIDEIDNFIQENTMPNTPKPGYIVEDETVTGGTDAATGAPVIRPKTTDGRADEATKPTDPREAPKPD